MSLGTFPFGSAPFGGSSLLSEEVIAADSVNDQAIAFRVSGLDADNDWTFGFGRANYKTNSNAVKQNLQTRIKSVVKDYWLDTTFGIDWDRLLGEYGTEKKIMRAVVRTALQTTGVLSISDVSVNTDKNRNATVRLSYRDIFTTDPQSIEVELA